MPVAAQLDAATLVRDLVRIPSLSGEEDAIADFVSEVLRARGIDVQRVGRSVLAQIEGAAPGATLLLNSHLDTVPAGVGWSADPWAADWQDGRLCALGANDAKGCVAAMIAALGALAERRDWNGTVQLALTAEEETTNRGMAEVLQHIEPPQAAITGEPTGLEVVRSQAGLVVLTARWSGRSCHAAHAARVEHHNALLTAATELASLPKCLHPGETHELLGASSLVATVLHAGDRHNRIPDLAEAVFDARLVPPTNAAECVRFLQQRLPGAEIGVRSQRLRAVDTPAEDLLVLCALACAGVASASGSTTLSDMALLHGVAAIKCGPGQSSRSHTPDEFVLQDELEAGADFYFQCSRSWLEQSQ